MCRRMARYSGVAAIADRFGVRARLSEPTPSWNLCAGTVTPIVRRAPNGRREIACLNWGLKIDHHLLDGADGSGTSVSALNIRRAALLQAVFPTNRCIVPIDAFYAGPAAWAKAAHVWAFALQESGLMGVAAIWLPDAAGGQRFAVITTGPNESVALVADSMPAVLFPEDERAWLSPHTDPYAAHNLIMPHPAERMRAWPVAAAREDGPEMLHRVA